MRFHPSRLAIAAATVSLLVVSPLARADVTVTTAADLATELATSPNTIQLGADIDLTGWTTVDGFSGTLDGQGYKITNLDAPLFGTITGDIAIRNLVVKDAYVTVTAETSGILLKDVSTASLAVENVTFTGSTLRNPVNKGNVGFVVGKFTVTTAATFTNCHVDDTCSFALGGNQHAGIAGNGTAKGTDATISFTHCTMAAALSTALSYGSQFGGIAGNISVQGSGGSSSQYAHLIMDGCTNHSSTATTWSGANRSYAGLVHTASGGGSGNMGEAVIRDCANYGSFDYKGNLTSSGTNYGGLLGNWSNGKLTMENCVNYGDILSTNTTSDTRSAIGGLVGSISSPIKVTVSFTGCANTGNIAGYYAGGLVGTISHNASYSSTKTYFYSCLNAGTITPHKDGTAPGEVICCLGSSVAYPRIDIEGGLYATSALIGNYAEGASVTTFNTNGNVSLDASDGLVDGTDLATLNDYESCDLWKQGHEYPILKILPNETAPDAIVATFKDWDETVLKQKTIARGWYVLAPADPARDGCTFLGWDPAVFTGLTADTTFTAQYSSGILSYTVSFVDWDDRPLYDQNVVHGEAVVAPASPTREGYLFIGWDTAFDNVTENLTIHAMYVAEHLYVGNVTDLATTLSPELHPGVTVHLTADVELPADWASSDFSATLDCAGHTIYCSNGGLPLFHNLHGSAANFVLDAGSGGAATIKTLANSATFGAVAATLAGGSISDVTVENLEIKTGDTCKAGFLAGVVADSAAIKRCTVADTCTIRTKNNSAAGGIAGTVERTTDFAPQDGEGTILLGEALATIADCTNNAPCVVTAGAVAAGGIVGHLDNMFNSAYRPNVYILRCANNGAFSASVSTGSSGSSVGGIVGRRSYNSGGHGGILHIIDCANNADLASPGTSGASLGGIVGYFWRGCETVVERCVNRGDIGTAVAGDGASAVTGNNVGGIFGYVSSLYSGNPVTVTNSANYGAITAGGNVGGLAGGVDANAGHGDTKLMFYNCANYGTLVGTDADALTGQIFAKFGTTVSTSSNRQYGAVNSFFMTDDFYAENTGSRIILEGLVTAEDEGYKTIVAKRTLNEAVAESEGAYEEWMVGMIGPELLPFWDHYSPNTLILFQ